MKTRNNITAVALLCMLLLPSMLWATEAETLDPNSDVVAEWIPIGCLLGHWECLSDDDDGDLVYVDNTQGEIDLYQWENTGVGEGTIDSVRYTVRDSITHVNNEIAVLDSVAGQSSAMRQSSSIMAIQANEWAEHSVGYATNPDGDPWSWDDVDALVAGIYAANTQNKAKSYVSEVWLNVYYTEAAEGTSPRREKITAGVTK